MPKPTIAFGLSLTGALLIVVGSLLFLVIFPGAALFFGLALLFGVIALLGSLLLYAFPDQHVMWGVVVLIFSALSLIGVGGFVVGSILAIIGGALGLSWSPVMTSSAAPMPGPYGVPVMPWRLCMGCGRWIPWAYNVCPLCGTQAPVAPWVPRAVAPPATPAAMPGAPSPTLGTAPPAGAYAPPPAPQPVTAPCPTCNGEAMWSAPYGRWYCPTEQRYF